MKNDLLYAIESINWAEANFPTFERDINIWVQNNINVSFKDIEANSTDYLMVFEEKQLFPFKFSVEFGAYVNVIRSSLDILATSLAIRFGIPRPDKMYFPIAESEAAFFCQRYKGKEFINGLPANERTIIEGLKPYKGGNDSLWVLHNLDIVRKHRRLLEIQVIPSQIAILGIGTLGHFNPIAGVVRGDNDTVLGFYSKNAPKPDVDLRVSVSIAETDLLPHIQVGTALRNFASLAKSIINLFDY